MALSPGGSNLYFLVVGEVGGVGVGGVVGAYGYWCMWKLLTVVQLFYDVILRRRGGEGGGVCVFIY